MLRMEQGRKCAKMPAIVELSVLMKRLREEDTLCGILKGSEY